MAKRVFKYQLSDAAGRSFLPLPRGARVLSCGEQAGVIVVWAEVDQTAPLVPLRVETVLTGDQAPSDMRFIGTVQINLGHTEFVVHVYVEATDA